MCIRDRFEGENYVYLKKGECGECMEGEVKKDGFCVDAEMEPLLETMYQCSDPAHADHFSELSKALDSNAIALSGINGMETCREACRQGGYRYSAYTSGCRCSNGVGVGTDPVWAHDMRTNFTDNAECHPCPSHRPRYDIAQNKCCLLYTSDAADE